MLPQREKRHHEEETEQQRKKLATVGDQVAVWFIDPLIENHPQILRKRLVYKGHSLYKRRRWGECGPPTVSAARYETRFYDCMTKL